jgi:hypothetical protein
VIYDLWLLQGPGGPYDEGEPPSEFERAAQEFQGLPPRLRARVRRLGKRKYQRKRKNRDWRRRQLREDINGQAIY